MQESEHKNCIDEPCCKIMLSWSTKIWSNITICPSICSESVSVHSKCEIYGFVRFSKCEGGGWGLNEQSFREPQRYGFFATIVLTKHNVFDYCYVLEFFLEFQKKTTGRGDTEYEISYLYGWAIIAIYTQMGNLVNFEWENTVQYTFELNLWAHVVEKLAFRVWDA